MMYETYSAAAYDRLAEYVQNVINRHGEPGDPKLPKVGGVDPFLNKVSLIGGDYYMVEEIIKELHVTTQDNSRDCDPPYVSIIIPERGKTVFR